MAGESIKTNLDTLKTKEATVTRNKVANFAYEDTAYNSDNADGVTTYDYTQPQNIPLGEASVLSTNTSVLTKGYRTQASSISRMLVNHFFGRTSYNLNKVNDIMSLLLSALKDSIGTEGGLACLDENGRIPYEQLPESAIELKGSWNASTNTTNTGIHLISGTGTLGDMYTVSEGGWFDSATGTGSPTEVEGYIEYFSGDRVIYDGTAWTRYGSGDVKTVNGVAPIDGNVTIKADDISDIYDKIYPVGSLYWSSNNTNPGTLFGGTWTAITDTVIVAKGTNFNFDDSAFFTAQHGAKDTTVGFGKIKITVSQLPSHSHTLNSGNTSTSGTKTTAGLRGVANTSGAGTAHNHGENLALISDQTLPYVTTSSYTGGGISGAVINPTASSATVIAKVSNRYRVNTDTESAHTHSTTAKGYLYGSTDNSGDGTAIDIMPPYITRYCWERTA